MVIHPGRIQCVDPASNHLAVKNNDSAHKYTHMCVFVWEYPSVNIKHEGYKRITLEAV